MGGGGVTRPKFPPNLAAQPGVAAASARGNGQFGVWPRGRQLKCLSAAVARESRRGRVVERGASPGAGCGCAGQRQCGAASAAVPGWVLLGAGACGQ